MKIRKAVKVAVTGAVFALPAITAQGAVSLGNFTTSASGTDTIITAADLTSMTCSATVGTEDGFLQRTCNDGSANYIQTIVYENGTEGEFKDSSLVMTGSGNNGVANYNSIVNGTSFSNVSEIQTDTLLTNDILGTNNAIDFTQDMNDFSITGETFTNHFRYVEDAAENGEITINQSIKNNDVLAPDENINQKFDHYEIFATGAGQTDGSAGSVTFGAGDYIATTLINNELPGLSAFSLQDFGNEGGGATFEGNGGETGVDSLATTGPHYAITYTGGTDVFTYTAFP